MPEGLFEPTVMFFGLTNLPATFQMMMNTIFQREVALEWLLVYMDDITIHTKPKQGETDEEHRERHRQYTHHVLKCAWGLKTHAGLSHGSHRYRYR